MVETVANFGQVQMEVLGRHVIRDQVTPMSPSSATARAMSDVSASTFCAAAACGTIATHQNAIAPAEALGIRELVMTLTEKGTDARGVPAAHRQGLRQTAHVYEIASMGPLFHALDVIQVDDRRAVDAEEEAVRESRLPLLQ